MRSFASFVLVSAALQAVMLVAKAAEPALPPPNILVILADDLGYGDLGCYGAGDLQTPHIDQFAKDGVRFENFYANCPVCSPTRASLLTGKYPELVGVPGVIRTHPEDSWGYLAEDAVLLPAPLEKAGYTTALVGKWHLGLEPRDHPLERGFDYFHGFLGDMMDDYYTHRRFGNNYMRRQRDVIDPEGHATELFSDWACEFLEHRESETAPFFLLLTYNAPHTPIQPPQAWVDRVVEREPAIEPRRAKLVALIEQMDAGIGRVIRTLRETGQYENTLVIFTSDNGGQLSVGANNGPLRDGKQSMYEGGIKVPCLAVWPAKIAPGTEIDVQAMTMDLFPTLCEIAGVAIESPVDGVSLTPQLRGANRPLPMRPLFYHRREGNRRYQGLTTQAVRLGDWKLLKNSPFQPYELYHLADDPREEHDLAGEQRGKFDELAALMRRQIQRGGSVPWQPVGRQ